MSLLDLTNVPKNEADWAIFSFANRAENARIRQAIQKQKSVNLTEYTLDPINLAAVQTYLQNNSQAHTDFNAALGLQSSDLLDVDITNEQQLSAWIDLNYQEVYSAEQALGI